MTTKLPKEVHLVLKGGHPLHARMDREEALADAYALIKKDYDWMVRHDCTNGVVLPTDHERAIVKWGGIAPATSRITVLAVRLKVTRKRAVKT